MANDFPAMIYSFNRGSKIVTNSEELEAAKKDGWQTMPFEMTEEIVRKQIAWHLSEAERLEAMLPQKEQAEEPTSEPAQEPEQEPVATEPRQKRKYTRHK